MIVPTINHCNWIRLYHSLLRSIPAFLCYFPGARNYPAGQRLSVPELYNVAWSTGMLDPTVDVIPRQQTKESTQGHMKRMLVNRLPPIEGLAMVYTYAARLFHYNTFPPSDSMHSFFNYFCYTLAEVIMLTMPEIVDDLIIHE